MSTTASLAAFSFSPPFIDINQHQQHQQAVSQQPQADKVATDDLSYGFDFSSFSSDSSGAYDSTFSWDLLTGSGNGFDSQSDEPAFTDSSSTPSSTEIISPKSSFSSFGEVPSPFASVSVPAPVSAFATAIAPAPSCAQAAPVLDIEALSKHHFERFLHYKTLADEAERKAAASAATAAAAAAYTQPAGGFETLLAPLDMNVHAPISAPADVKPAFENSLLMSAPSYNPQHHVQQAYDAQQQQQQPSRANASFVYNPHTAQASVAQAQADAHLHAHNVAMAQVQQQRHMQQQQQQQQAQYWIDSHARASIPMDAASIASASMSEPAWSRSSFSTNHTGSPPYPSTPDYSVASGPGSTVVQSTSASVPVAVATLPMPLTVPAMPFAPSFAPSAAAPLQPIVPIAPSVFVPDALVAVATAVAPASHKSHRKPVLNPHGGGRGYVPGQTPDDPKKRHKCDVCGRAFARAFNLKSHASTHDPERSKPHMCPHGACKRGFSRLHDLERHRQGIHNDGPLVDAKRAGVTPSVARAKGRSSSRASSVRVDLGNGVAPAPALMPSLDVYGQTK